MRTVLVIDDSELIRMAAEIGLSAAGWTVLTADSGAEGVSVAEREQPDAVLLDLVMPGLDGAQTLAAMRRDARTRDIPVVFLTARADQVPVGGSDPPAAGVIEKPFAPTALAGTLSGILEWER